MWNALANEGHSPLTRGQQQQTQKKLNKKTYIRSQVLLQFFCVN